MYIGNVREPDERTKVFSVRDTRCDCLTFCANGIIIIAGFRDHSSCAHQNVNVLATDSLVRVTTDPSVQSAKSLGTVQIIKSPDSVVLVANPF